MPSVYDLKPAFQNLLRPICRGLAAAGVTANQITVAAVVLSGLAGGAIAMFPDQPHLLLLIPVALFVRMALNAIDGMLAREHGMKSPLGGILNELGDVVSDAALYLPFAVIPDVPAAAVVVVVLLAVVSEMTGVVAVAIGASRRYDGPMGKSDRALWFGVLATVLGVGVSPRPWIGPALLVITLLLLLTIVNRVRRALREVS